MSAARHKKVDTPAPTHRQSRHLPRLFPRGPRWLVLLVTIVVGATLAAVGATLATTGGAAADSSSIYIHAGGGAFTDSQGIQWSADRYFVGGLTASTRHGIAATTSPALYQVNRWGVKAYNVPVANGAYVVTIDTSETYWSDPGKRVFSSTVQGQPLFTNLDLVAQVGANTAFRASASITVTNGFVNIGFTAPVDNSVVSGIEIIPSDTQKAAAAANLQASNIVSGVGSGPVSGNPTSTWTCNPVCVLNSPTGPASTTAAPPAVAAVPEKPSVGGSSSSSSSAATKAAAAAAPASAPTCSAGVAVVPGANLQALVNAAPAGTSFTFAPGRYVGMTADVKAGDRFCGAGMGSTTLDGGGMNAPAFYAGSSSDDNVVVTGFTITNYAPSAKLGAVDSDATSDRAQGWQVVSNNINHNSQIGVAVGSGSVVSGNYLTDNGRYGLTGGGAGSVFSYNEIARNNANRNDTGDAGGTKFAVTTNLLVSHNYVHDNIGPGLWADIDNIGTVYDSNLVTGNSEAGIFEEISYNCQVSNNVIKGNGGTSSPWVMGAGVAISNSQNCQVFGNYLEDNANGIIGIASIRGGDPTLGNYLGTWLLVHNNYHDNYVRQARGVSGVAGDCTPNGSTCLDPSAAASANTFARDHYFVSSAFAFSWGPGTKTFPQWQSAGQESGGTSAAYAAYPGAPAIAVGPTAFH